MGRPTEGCWLFHRWDDGEWVSGIAEPVFLFTCRRCGREKVRMVTP